MKGMKLPVKKKKEEKSAAEKEAEKKILAYKCQQERQLKNSGGYTLSLTLTLTLISRRQLKNSGATLIVFMLRGLFLKKHRYRWR